jgi:hypothetical protein
LKEERRGCEIRETVKKTDEGANFAQDANRRRRRRKEKKMVTRAYCSDTM